MRPSLARWLQGLGCLHADEYAFARGIAVGLFIGLTPTVGIQISLMILSSWLFRANFLAAFMVSWVSNPLTMAPLYFAWHSIGEAAFGWLLAPLARLSGISGNIIEGSTRMLAGSLMTAIPAAIGGYFLSVWITHKRQARRALRRSQAAAKSGRAAPPAGVTSSKT